MLQIKKTDEESERLARIILRNIQVGTYAPDNKLPSESQLLKIYGSDIYHVRKAISLLKREGHLYSIPKFGVFVKKNTEQNSTGTNQHIRTSEDMCIVYSSRNATTPQQTLWNEALQKFTSAHVAKNFTNSFNNPEGPLPHGDLYEYSCTCKDFRDTELLNIQEYFPSISRYPELMPDPYSLPLYYSTCLLCYNENILKKLGVKTPDYQNFEEQQAYLETVIKKTAKYKEYVLPGTSQPVNRRLGKYSCEMYTDIINGITESAFRKKYQKTLFLITDFWEHYPPSEPGESALISYENFIKGKTPFFFGWSLDYTKITEDAPSFHWNCAMMYAIDNTFPRIPLMLAIDKKSKNPVECLRMAKILQTPECRQGHTKNGMIPLLDEEYKDLPFSLVITPEKKGKVDFLTPEVYYTICEIINSELTDVILRKKALDDAISDLIMFVRGYHRMNQENHA